MQALVAGPTARGAMPALLNAQSIRPNADTVCHHCGNIGLATSPPIAIA
jgi:hypothetical protein